MQKMTLYFIAESMLAEFETVRTTLTLPVDLVKRSQHFIDDGTIPSRNVLIVTDLEWFLLELERQEEDEEYNR